MRLYFSACLVVALGCAPVALPAVSATDPKQLVLQPGDLPAVKQSMAGVPPASVSNARYHVVSYRIGAQARGITSAAYVFGFPGAARRGFGQVVAAYAKYPKLKTSSLGDQQLAGGLKTRGYALVGVYVRSGSVVWGVTETRLSPTATFSQMTPGVVALARKQRARIAS